jgi:hypothetical protein
MSQSRGKMSLYCLFHAEEIGVSKEPNLDRLVKVFLQISEGIVVRWVQMPNGLLLLVMAPDDPASGAVYLYDRIKRTFSLVCFEGADDTLTVPEFDELLEEYSLIDCASNPSLCQPIVHPVAVA